MGNNVSQSDKDEDTMTGIIEDSIQVIDMGIQDKGLN